MNRSENRVKTELRLPLRPSEKTQICILLFQPPSSYRVRQIFTDKKIKPELSIHCKQEFFKGFLPPFSCRSVLTLGVGVSRLAQEDMVAMEGVQGNGLLSKLPTVTTSQHQVVTRAHLALEVEEVIIKLCSPSHWKAF